MLTMSSRHARDLLNLAVSLGDFEASGSATTSDGTGPSSSGHAYDSDSTEMQVMAGMDTGLSLYLDVS